MIEGVTVGCEIGFRFFVVYTQFEAAQPLLALVRRLTKFGLEVVGKLETFMESSNLLS
jgi:hypothetical protein